MNHHSADRIALDFGSTPVTGIHVKIIEQLRAYYGLEKRPVKVTEPYQMLGEVDEELMQILDIDVIGISGPRDMMGHKQENFVEKKLPWGQIILLPESFNTKEENSRLFVFPQGDTTVPPCATMPEDGYFFDAIERVPPVEIDAALDVNDNLEEFLPISDDDLRYWAKELEKASGTGRAVVANIGGTALGDIALVPAMQLKHPKGIRSIEDWYMSTVLREEYIHQIFDKQTDIAIENLTKINRVAGQYIDVIFLCGTDFGTQDSQFCSVETFLNLYGPYYKRINNWIHQNTSWKTFKHSCGAIEPLLEALIDCGFDIINPVQINAKNMNPQLLKEKYGDRVTFWGGGIDTQKVLPFGTQEQIRKQVQELCDIFGKDGGFVFNTVHNLQANVPFENIVALVETIKNMRY